MLHNKNPFLIKAQYTTYAIFISESPYKISISKKLKCNKIPRSYFDFPLIVLSYMVLAPCMQNINKENINSLFSTTLIIKLGFIVLSNIFE